MVVSPAWVISLPMIVPDSSTFSVTVDDAIRPAALSKSNRPVALLVLIVTGTLGSALGGSNLMARSIASGAGPASGPL